MGTKKRRSTSLAIARAAARKPAPPTDDVAAPHASLESYARVQGVTDFVEGSRSGPDTHPVFASFGDAMVGGLALMGGLLGVPMTIGEEKLGVGETIEVGVSLLGRWLSRMARPWLEGAREDEIAVQSWENEGGSYR